MSSSSTNYPPGYLDQDSGPSVIFVAIFFAVLDIIFGLLQLASVRLTKRAFGIDNAFSYLALLIILAQCAMVIPEIMIAFVGRHLAWVLQFHPESLPNEYKTQFAIELIYISSFTFSKLSMLHLYLRIFNTKIPRYITYGLIAFMWLTWLGESLSAIFQCTPTRYVWDKSITNGHCVQQVRLWQFWSVPNIVSDVAMLTLPMPVVWKIQTRTIQKVGLALTFLLGSIGLIACCIRFYTFSHTVGLADATWASVDLQIWTIVEPSMYYIAAILVTLRPVASYTLQKFRTKNSMRFASYRGSSGKSLGRRTITSKFHRLWPTKRDQGDTFTLVESGSNTVNHNSLEQPLDNERGWEQRIVKMQEFHVVNDRV